MHGPAGGRTNKPVVDTGTLIRQQSKAPQSTGAATTLSATGAAEAPPTSNWRVYLGFKGGKPVIYEYTRSNHLCSVAELTFKTVKPRNWYEVGDLVLCAEDDEKALQQRFKELQDKNEAGESGLLTLVSGLLGEPPTKYKYGYKVVYIQPWTADGGGDVGLRPVLFLDEKTFIELEASGSKRTRLQLHENWVDSDYARGMQIWETVALVYYQAALALAGGVASGLLKGTARGVLLLTFKEAMGRAGTRALLRKTLAFMAKESMKLMRAGVSAYVTTFIKTYHSESAKAKLAARASHGQVNREVIDVCVAKATGAFAAAIVKEAMNPYLNRAINAAGLGWVQKEITDRIVNAFIKGVPLTFINALSEAAAKAANDPGQFEKHFEDELLKQTTDLFKKLVEVDFKKIGGALAAG